MFGHRYKQTQMLSWPQVLVISLKRFSWDVATQTSRKMPTRVDYEVVLRPSQDSFYDLRAVIVHLGAFVDSGHYVAYFRGISDNF